eukprot:6521213-Pyramimonas_sp.AAC.1
MATVGCLVIAMAKNTSLKNLLPAHRRYGVALLVGADIEDVPTLDPSQHAERHPRTNGNTDLENHPKRFEPYLAGAELFHHRPLCGIALISLVPVLAA